MNETETNLPAQNTGLEFQVEALQRQVFLLLLGLIVVTATFVFYLYYQEHIFRHDLDQITPRAKQVIQAYNHNALAIDNFNKQLVNYALAHPEFQPILKKYGWTPNAPKPQ